MAKHPPRRTGYLTNIQTKVLLAVLAGHKTGNDIAKATGIAYSSVWRALQRLQKENLVHWEPRLHGTIRPLVTITNQNPTP
jgi:DNA-binding MarR family transcriptional regulator